MGRITLSMKSEKKTGDIFTVSDFKEKYLYGVEIMKDGKELPEKTYEHWIEFAKKQIETFLTIKLDLQILEETKNYNHNDWKHWGQIKATYPVECGLQVDGYFGKVRQVTYPKEWISVKKSNDELNSRLIHIVPNSSTVNNQTAGIFTGIYANAGWIGGGHNTPNYWTIKYITGFKKVPLDIQSAIGMLAAINVLTVGNETLASAMGALGTGSKSISIDGLSQSTSMYINGNTGIFGARIKQYSDTLMGDTGLLQRLKDYYGAIVWTSA